MLNRFENKIINLINITPLVTLFIFTIIITYVLSEQNNSYFEKEKETLRTDYIQAQKTIVKHEVDIVYDLISFEKSNGKNKLKEYLKSRVYEAHSIALNVYNKNREKTSQEIKELIKDSLSNIRFNSGRGYYFIYDLKGNNILHPILKNFENTNKISYKDLNNKKVIQNLISISKNENEGFDTWFWSKPRDTNNEYEKLGFVKKFEPYDWIIGTGEYVLDFEKELKEEVLKKVAQFKYNKNGYVFIIDYDGVYLNHIREDLLNKNLYNLKDKNGVLLTQEIIKAAKSENHFVEYTAIDGTSIKKGLKKISYIRGLDEWRWAIGSGFQPEMINETIENKNQELITMHETTKRKIYFTVVAVMLLMIIALIIFSNKIKELFEQYKNRNKMFQEKLRELLSDKSRVLNSSLDTIDKYVSITRTDKKGIITYATKNFCDDVGFSKDELIGKNHNIVRHPDTKPFIFKDMWQTIKKGNVYKNILKNKTKSNGEIWFDIVIQPEYNRDRQIIGYTAVRKNITDKKIIEELNSKLEVKIENAIKKNRQKDNILAQQSKMAAIGEMLENIAHQWRQPLSMISTAASGLQLQKEFNLLDEKTFQDSINIIMDNSQYLSQTIEGFRDFFNSSNILEPLVIADIINKAKSMSTYEENNQIKIHENIEDITFLGYKNELLQILINLLNNSSDAFKSNKNIKQRFVFIDATKSNNNVKILLRDNAGGIPNDIINKVFEPYFTTKHQYVGTGIGLYMCMEIITKMMHGTISVKNKKFTYENIDYMGAEFKIEIPISPRKNILENIKQEFHELKCFKWDENKGMFIKNQICKKKELYENIERIIDYLNEKGINYKILDTQDIILDVNKI